jgi:GTP-binding protein
VFSGELSTKLRIYYVTQVGVAPPTFAVFVNKLDNIPKGFENFFIKKVTEIFDFKGVPIKVNFIEKERKKTK